MKPAKPSSPQELPHPAAPAARPPRKPSARTARPRGCWATCALFGGASVLVLTLVVACMALIMTLQVADFLGDPVDNFLAVFGFEKDATPTVTDSRTIVLSVQELALLETVQSGIVITKTVVDSGAAPDAELQISYTGTIKAGIDLATIDEDDITVTPDGAVRLVLPPPHITYCDLGKPEVHAWTCRGWAGLQDCSSRYERMQGEAYNRAMGDLLEAAETMDLLGLARQNAEATLYDLLQKLGFASVTFEVSGETPPSRSLVPAGLEAGVPGFGGILRGAQLRGAFILVVGQPCFLQVEVEHSPEAFGHG